ncbi:MAG: response regulator transcription factor [Planctomycetota bacterium]|jgi:DNA-binding NarL/FixJ family response regulator|nr:response regulator transcription factor [Planctomycetota bacterium]
MNHKHSPARILIVDDHSMVREGLRLRISAFADLEVCGEATTEEEAMVLIEQSNPQLIIVDISLKSGHGLELMKRVKASYPNIKMLVSSGFQESLYAERSLRAGALGYLNKQDSGEKVIDAIRTVLRGERYVSPEITQRLVSQALGNKNESKDPIDLLTDRELEILRMIGKGQTSGAIANDLFLSSHTIDTHRENIKRKLGLKNAAELSRRAVQFVLENS